MVGSGLFDSKFPTTMLPLVRSTHTHNAHTHINGISRFKPKKLNCGIFTKYISPLIVCLLFSFIRLHYHKNRAVQSNSGRFGSISHTHL